MNSSLVLVYDPTIVLFLRAFEYIHMYINYSVQFLARELEANISQENEPFEYINIWVFSPVGSIIYGFCVQAMLVETNEVGRQEPQESPFCLLLQAQLVFHKMITFLLFWQGFIITSLMKFLLRWTRFVLSVSWHLTLLFFFPFNKNPHCLTKNNAGLLFFRSKVLLGVRYAFGRASTTFGLLYC